MRVQAIKSFASAHGCPAPGETLDVPDEVAREWIRLGLAQRVGIETAVRSAPEAAVVRKGKQ
jgi:hypothetical protein